MQLRFRIGLALGVVLSAALLIAATALGADIRVASTVTLAKPNPFHGHVSARRHLCEVNRLVRVIQIKGGHNQVLGSTHTNRQGKWSIPATKAPNGDYYARVKRRKKFNEGGFSVVCTADHSAIRHF
jgi:hypothetical protein